MTTRRSIVFAGFAGKVGGAGTEAFETMRMFRVHGLDVHCFPTWDAPPTDRLAEVKQLGVTVHTIKPPQVAGLLRELDRPPVLSFCNKNALSAYGQTRGISPFVWANCMTFLMPEERIAWKKHGVPEAFVFQSEYQRQTLENALARFGYRDTAGHSIRGAFWWPDWTFAPLPRESGSPFVVGRVARADPSKWSSTTFKSLDGVPNIKALLMGVNQSVARNLERRRYATVLPPGHLPAQQFYGQIHAMIAKNGSARENWPRVGLEAMALGVPVVADAQWGWKEMIRHGETGFLAGNVPEFTAAFELLEQDEQLRLKIARQARRSLETELANPAAIWRGWCGLFQSIGAGHLTEEPPRQPPPSAIQVTHIVEADDVDLLPTFPVADAACDEPGGEPEEEIDIGPQGDAPTLLQHQPTEDEDETLS